MSLRRRFRSISEHDEDGMILIMVLIFISLIGFVTAALLSYETAAFRQTSSVRKVDLRQTGTNGGIDWAVQTIRSGSDSFCQGNGLWTKDLTIGNRTVRVFCRMTAGTPSGPGGIALYGNGGVIDTGGPKGATVTGPVYNAGTYAGGLNLTVNAEVSAPGPCAGGTVLPPPGLTALYGSISLCDIPLTRVATPLLGVPTVNNGGIVSPTPVNPLAQDVTFASKPCRIFSPGTYTTPPALLNNNYFKPGVYYFDWSTTNTWNISSAVWAGDPVPATANSPGDNVISTIPRCGGLAASAPYGVQFVFGRKANMAVRNQGRVEMFSYLNGTGVLPGVRAIVGGDLWGSANSLPVTTPLVSVGNGSKAELVIHGGMYAPNNLLKMRGTNTSLAKIMGTTVVYALTTFAPASFGDNAFIDVPSGAGSRKFVLMARSEQLGTEPPLCTVSSLSVFNNAARSFNVDGWRVDRDATGLDLAGCTPP